MLNINRYIVTICLLLSNICINAQRQKVKTYYDDGKLESKGLTYTYSIFSDNKQLPKDLRYWGDIQKKVGEWKYFHRNGELKKIENFVLVKDRKYSDLPDGKWMYFNDLGIIYREDTYSNGTLVNSMHEIYNDNQLAGKISLNFGIFDTVLYVPFSKEKNLIINPDFDFFYYQPILISYNGKSKIEDWIPFWTTPGDYTPDYISNFRYIDALSYFYLFDMPLPEKFNYVGIALYKESEDYSEYIQGKLISPLNEGKKYCLRTSINLCSYSKYATNRIAFYLSESSISVNSKNESNFVPQVKFSGLPFDNKQFVTLCDYFNAHGGEQIITVGRFSKPENLILSRRESIPQSVFGLEKSSYYLINNIELFEIHDTTECLCQSKVHFPDSIKGQPKEIYETDLNKLKKGIPVVLENVNFEFDSYVLIKSSEAILNTLLNYLTNNPDISIIIEGHTDDTGTEDYNLQLSIDRAKSVYNWLINKGIDSGRISFAGFGKTRPIYNDTEENHRALNRRVEVRIIND